MKVFIGTNALYYKPIRTKAIGKVFPRCANRFGGCDTIKDYRLLQFQLTFGEQGQQVVTGKTQQLVFVVGNQTTGYQIRFQPILCEYRNL